MSTKFEQLLDLIVNEEMDKANELFHEIVVEKSRDIYENLIAEEAEEEMDEAADDEEMDESAEDEEMDESAEDDEEEMDESADEEADESIDLEDSYSMEADDEEGEMGGDATDDFGGDIGGDDMGGDEGPEAGEDKAIFDIKNAIAELEAAFAELEQAQGGEEHDMDMGMDGEEDGEDEDEGMMMGMHEGRRMTREYTEKVGNDWDKNSMKTQGQYVGAGSGDKEGAPVEGRSPISSGSGKPTSTASAKNLVQGDTEGSSNTGTSPAKGSKGINPASGEKFAKGMHNVDGIKSGVKTLAGVKGGHGAEKKGGGPGPVGSGTGDKAGQTSVGKIPTFLKKF
jgi:hypothetical protein